MRRLRSHSSFSSSITFQSARLSPTASPPSTVLFRPDGAQLPTEVEKWVGEFSTNVVSVASADELMAMALRGRPRLVIFDARSTMEEAFAACGRLKRDSYTGVVPAVLLTTDDKTAFRDGFATGADEIIQPMLSPEAVRCRLDAVLA